MPDIPSIPTVSEAIIDLIKAEPDYLSIAALSHLFKWNGKPLTLNKHFYTHPFYTINPIPQCTTFMTGRQLGKTLAEAFQSHLRAWLKSHWHLLVFTPLYSQVAYLSTNYFGPAITQSPVRRKFVGKHHTQNVLEKRFKNGSSELFSYAWNNVDRMRGKSVDAITGDEMQDFDYEFLPVIEEALSAREHAGVRQFAGTPKTTDNTLTSLFEDGSQAEWVIKCPHCNTYNIPNLENHILKMIGKEGVVCGANCYKPIQKMDVGYTLIQKKDLYIRLIMCRK